MRLVVFDDHRLGTLEDDGIHDVTELVDAGTTLPAFAAPYRMNALIGAFDQLRPSIEERRGRGPAIPVTRVHLRAPSPRPRNFLAAPRNYAAHGAEMQAALSAGPGTPRDLGLFVKAGGCLCGPNDDIELPPIPDRRFDHEAEIGVVIGRAARGVPAERALEHVFGYTLVLDATMRMTETQREERTMRKSFATFSPSGPCVVTADEVGDPAGLDIRLHVGDELRQEGTLAELIVDVAGLVELGSSIVELEPGDLIATGTPAGVGPIEPGDVVTVRSERIGQMRMLVTRRGW